MDEHIKRIQIKMKGIPGDDCEKSFFKSMKEFFEGAGQQVFGFNGLEVFQKGRDGREGIVEKDFLLINLTHGYIMSIECKATLYKDVFKKAVRQIKGIKQYLEEQIPHLLNGLKFYGVIYSTEVKAGFKPCMNCSDYIIIGEGQIKEKLGKIGANGKMACPKQFKEIIKNLAYKYQANHNLPVSSAMVQIAMDQIEKAGTVENVKLLSFWTPGQIGLMSAMDCPKVLLQAPFSVGKTLILTERALKLAKEDRRVKYYIQGYQLGK